MDVCALLVTNAQPSILVQPRYRAFNHPALPAESAAVPSPALADQWLDQPVSQLASMMSRIIASVAQQCVRTLLGPTPLAADGWPFVVGAAGRVFIDPGLNVYVSLRFLLA